MKLEELKGKTFIVLPANRKRGLLGVKRLELALRDEDFLTAKEAYEKAGFKANGKSEYKWVRRLEKSGVLEAGLIGRTVYCRLKKQTEKAVEKENE